MLDRTVAPPIREIRDFVIPPPAHHKLSNGAPLFFINDSRLNVVKIEIHFEAGRWYENVPMTSSFFARLFKEGTGLRSSEDINMALESQGAFIELTPGFDRIAVNIFSLVDRLDQVLSVVGEILTDFKVKEDELIKQREIQYSQLQVNLEKTGFLAGRAFRNNLFGSAHPYGKINSLEDVEQISSEAVQSFYQERIKGAAYTIIASGNIGESQIDLIEKYLGTNALESSGLSSGTEIDGKYSSETVDRESAVQSSLIVGRFMPDRAHENTHQIAVVNEILGGYFGSRLMKNLREDKGYTYGMYSRISHLEQASYLAISADVIKDSREDALNEVRKELNLLGEKGIGSEELELVRNYMLGSLSTSVDSVFSIAQLFRMVHFAGLDFDYFRNRVETIKTITAGDIQDISARYFNSEDMVEVIVG